MVFQLVRAYARVEDGGMELYGSAGRALDLLFVSVRQALFAELQKSAISFFMSVCLSVCLYVRLKRTGLPLGEFS